jgi:hypothetical protein
MYVSLLYCQVSTYVLGKISHVMYVAVCCFAGYSAGQGGGLEILRHFVAVSTGRRAELWERTGRLERMGWKVVLNRGFF